MVRKDFHKLIRDKIPEKIAANGARAEIRELDEKEYIEALKRKILEEGGELERATELTALDEIADVYEVLAALTKALGITDQQVQDARKAKVVRNGGFEKRLFLEWTEE